MNRATHPTRIEKKKLREKRERPSKVPGRDQAGKATGLRLEKFLGRIKRLTRGRSVRPPGGTQERAQEQHQRRVSPHPCTHRKRETKPRNPSPAKRGTSPGGSARSSANTEKTCGLCSSERKSKRTRAEALQTQLCLFYPRTQQ